MQDQVKKSLKVVNYTGIAALTLLLAGTLAFGVIPMRNEGLADIRMTAEKRAAFDHAEALRPVVMAAQAQAETSQQRLNDAENACPRASRIMSSARNSTRWPMRRAFGWKKCRRWANPRRMALTCPCWCRWKGRASGIVACDF